MERRDWILAVLAAAKGETHSPVQIQKILFLLDEKVAASVGGKFFNFRPYHYGPFDKEVYQILEDLNREGLVTIGKAPGSAYNQFRTTRAGQETGARTLEGLQPPIQQYIKKISDFCRSLSFDELVSTVYKAYPDMKKRSVFQG